MGLVTAAPLDADAGIVIFILSTPPPLAVEAGVAPVRMGVPVAGVPMAMGEGFTPVADDDDVSGTCGVDPVGMDASAESSTALPAILSPWRSLDTVWWWPARHNNINKLGKGQWRSQNVDERAQAAAISPIYYHLFIK